MLSKKSFGIAGAAMLGTVALLGTNAANAAINLDGDADDATVTFAQETVIGMVGEDGNYYEVNGGSDTDNTGTTLDVRNAIGLGATQDTEMVVTYMLQGMVFGTALASDSIALHPATDTSFNTGDDKLTGATGQRALISGGGEGDMEAVFHVSVQEAPIAQDDVLILHVQSLGVMPGGGTVKVTIRNTVDDMEVMGKNMGMVVFDTGVLITNDPMNAKTYVARNYRDFGHDGTDPDLIDDVGGFMVGTQHLDATDGIAATLEDIFGTDRSDDKITFEDDWFGFADSAWLDSMADCSDGAAGTNSDVVWVEEDEAMVIKAVTLADLGDLSDTSTNKKYLCLMAPGDEAIPETGYYMAASMFMGVDGAKMPLMGMDDAVVLGMIERDGITVHLPYLTTSDRYVQRITIVNRNKDDVDFTIEFSNEDGKTADPMVYEGMAKGRGDSMMPGMVTSMKVADIVEITGTGAPRTAGTLMLESVPGMVDVATNQVNLERGTTDTIVYLAEEEKNMQ